MLYSEATAKLPIEEDIRKILGSVVKTIDFQLQDDGDFLLIQVELLERPGKPELEKWHRALKEHFSKMLPKPLAGQGYSWMINLAYEKWPLESVMDEINMS